jgi:hypothetical protein
VGIDQDSHFAVSLAIFLHVRQGDGFEAAVSATRNGGAATHVIQFVLAQVIDDAGADRVAENIYGRSKPEIRDSFKLGQSSEPRI